MPLMEQQEWLRRYTKLKAIADRVTEMRLTRFRALCKEAHVENGMMLHNAMVGLHYGKPWPSVNYEAAKKAYHWDQTGWLYEASRIVESWNLRVWNEGRAR